MINKIFYFFIFCTLLCASSVRAASGTPNLKNAFGDVLKNVAVNGGYQTADPVAIETTLGAIIQGILSALGIVFLAIIIYSGLMWMTAGGNEAKAGKAQNTIQQAIIGLIIVVAAYAISYFIVAIFGI